MPAVLDAAVRDDRHPELAGDAAHVIHGRGLPPAHGAHLLRRADAAAAHAAAQAVGAGFN